MASVMMNGKNSQDGGKGTRRSKLTLISTRDNLSGNWRAHVIFLGPCKSEIVGCFFATSCDIDDVSFDADVLWEDNVKGAPGRVNINTLTTRVWRFKDGFV